MQRSRRRRRITYQFWNQFEFLSSDEGKLKSEKFAAISFISLAHALSLSLELLNGDEQRQNEQ